MLVTEEEASTKRCHESFGQYYTTPDGRSMMSMAGNFGAGYALQASPNYCIGSACMAWRRRWRIVNSNGDHNDQTYGCEPKHLADGLTAQAIGYCGKAGKP